MANERVLYVCFDTSTLASRERLFMSMGLNVSTLLGMDGLLSARDVPTFDYILLGEEASPLDQQHAIEWLQGELSHVPTVIVLLRGNKPVAGADYQLTTDNSNVWADALAEYVREHRKLA
jgi:hypothetical protein